MVKRKNIGAYRTFEISVFHFLFRQVDEQSAKLEYLNLRVKSKSNQLQFEAQWLSSISRYLRIFPASELDNI